LRRLDNFLCDLLEAPEFSSDLMALCVEVALAVLDSVFGRRGLTFSVEIARQGGLRFVGPNCFGIFNSANGLNTLPTIPAKGEIGFISQSGSLVHMVASVASAKGYGFSKLVSAGNQADLDVAEANAKSLTAHLAQQEVDVTVAERQVDLYQQQLDDMIIRSPFSGIVTTKDAQPGEMISPVSAGGGFTRTGIGTIVDMESLEIEIDVNESYINRVEPGQAVEATLDAYPDWKVPCKVIAISKSLSGGAAAEETDGEKGRAGLDGRAHQVRPGHGAPPGRFGRRHQSHGEFSRIRTEETGCKIRRNQG
jgi:hypothetical protein